MSVLKIDQLSKACRRLANSIVFEPDRWSVKRESGGFCRPGCLKPTSTLTMCNVNGVRVYINLHEGVGYSHYSSRQFSSLNGSLIVAAFLRSKKDLIDRDRNQVLNRGVDRILEVYGRD